MKLEGKVAIVTGAGKGIGRGIAHCLAEEGADIVINALHQETAGKVADEVKALGRKSLAVAADVTKKEGTTRVTKETIDTFGRIDILVNNFGAHTEAFYTKKYTGFADQQEVEWDDDYQFNLKSMVLMCMAVVPHLVKQESGKIVNVSSVAGRLPVPSQMPYGAFKAGVNYFTMTLGWDLAKHNINVNGVAPGGVFSGMSERGIAKAIETNPDAMGMTPEEYWLKFVVPRVRGRAALKRDLTPEDIGRAVVFLASEDARNITSQTLSVDCGEFSAL